VSTQEITYQLSLTGKTVQYHWRWNMRRRLLTTSRVPQIHTPTYIW